MLAAALVSVSPAGGAAPDMATSETGRNQLGGLDWRPCVAALEREDEGERRIITTI